MSGARSVELSRTRLESMRGDHPLIDEADIKALGMRDGDWV